MKNLIVIMMIFLAACSEEDEHNPPNFQGSYVSENQSSNKVYSIVLDKFSDFYVGTMISDENIQCDIFYLKSLHILYHSDDLYFEIETTLEGKRKLITVNHGSGDTPCHSLEFEDYYLSLD